MLAAHRHGGRTSFIAFARAWDRFAGARRARPATERELRVLVAHLEALSSPSEAGPTWASRSPTTRRSPAPGGRATPAPRARLAARPPGRRARPRAARARVRRARRRRSRAPGRRARPGALGRDREPAAGLLEEDLGDHAAGGEAQQHPHRLGDVLGRIMSSAGTCRLTKSVIGVSTNAGHSAHRLDALAVELLVHRLGEADDGVLRGRVDRQPRLAALAGDRRGVDDERVVVLGARRPAAGRPSRGRRGWASGGSWSSWRSSFFVVELGDRLADARRRRC